MQIFIEDARYNFLIQPVDTMGYPYDYYSIMHYEGYAFSINEQPTMVPKQSGVVLPIYFGQSAISPIDAAEIKTLYKCS